MAFYQCLQCKRRWQYPLAECPYCMIPLAKMESKTAKVVGAVKVAIPTLFHPNVPYFVLLLEDEAGNSWGYKSEIEYKAGDSFELEPNKDAVAIWRVKYDIGEGIDKVLELIGGININQKSKIVILPTVVKASHSYFRDNTSPEFLSAGLEALRLRGAKIENITVAGQSFDEMPIGAIAQKSGLVKACQKFGITPLDLSSGEFEKIGKFEISKIILTADLAINLAIEKIGAGRAQNLFKVLKKENYLGQKYLSSETEMAVALEPILESKAITIGEAENIARSNKLTTFMGLILAGRSARNVDRVFNEVAQSFKLPEIIRGIAISDIPVAGRSIKEVQYQAEVF